MSRNGREREGPPAVDYLGQLTSVLPGDVIGFAAEEAHAVTTVLVCNEVIHGVTTEWRWIFLDDDSLIESAPKGRYRYREHRVLEQGTGPYEELVAQDGALVRFEKRVRARTVARRPVRVTLEGRAYRVAYTGTAGLQQRFGAQPGPLPWRSFRSDPDQNVYFGMIDAEDARSVVLGLWTVDICLSFGRALGPGDVTGIYAQNE